eukprot:gene24678-33149_t
MEESHDPEIYVGSSTADFREKLRSLSSNASNGTHRPPKKKQTAPQKKDSFRLVQSIRNSATPYIITDVAVANSIDALNEMPAFLSAYVRLCNSSNVFKYYSSDQLWSQNPILQNFRISEQVLSMKLFLDDRFRHILQSHSIVNSYFEKHFLNATDRVDSSTCSIAVNSSTHFYSTVPDILPVVEKVAPSMMDLYATLAGESRVSMWIASSGAVAALHYDMEDNFLLQVAGQKTVTLLSPEGYEIAQPLSSFHPSWRHTPHWDNLTDSASIIAEAERLYLDPSRPASTDNSNQSDTFSWMKSLGLGLWEISLGPGDMLFIPAGTYHTVTAGPDSISVSSWFPSTMSELYESLVSVELPFFRKDALALKLSQTAAVVRCVLRDLKRDQSRSRRAAASKTEEDIGLRLLNVRDFSQAMLSRYRNQSHAFPPSDSSSLSPAPDHFHLCRTGMAETSLVVRRVSSSIHAFLRASLLRPALLAVLLMDYMEEVVSLVVQQEQELREKANAERSKRNLEISDGDQVRVTPQWMESFIGECFDT